MDINAAVGGERGLSGEDRCGARRALGRSCAFGRERLALEYADRVSATPVDVPDDFFARLAAEFSEREIVELTATIAHENYNSKFNRPLRIEANNFCRFRYPRPRSCKRGGTDERPEATHDRLGADILSAHERLTRTIRGPAPRHAPRRTRALLRGALAAGR